MKHPGVPRKAGGCSLRPMRPSVASIAATLASGTNKKGKRLWLARYFLPFLYCILFYLTLFKGASKVVSYYEDELPQALLSLFPDIALDKEKLRVLCM